MPALVRKSSGTVYLALGLSVPASPPPPEIEQMKQPLLEAKLRLERVL